MKTSSLTIVILLLLTGAFSASAQYDLKTDKDYACWQCPVCGYIVSLTPAEAASISPYTPCPSCYAAYAGSFMPVSCQAAMEDSAFGYTSPEYDQPEAEDENVVNLQEDELYNGVDQTIPIPDDSERKSSNGLTSRFYASSGKGRS